jgi:hypothetical protein
MRKLILSLLAFTATTAVAFAGTEYSGKEMRQTTAPHQECWYADQEWNVNLWGTYAFTGTDSNGVNASKFFSGENHGDRYLETDHAWGGGGDVKFFWHKYFGLGVEGFVLDAKRTRFDFEAPAATPAGFLFTKTDDERTVGSVLGTITIRYPIGCTRFAPYVWGGGGAIFGGGQRDRVVRGFDVTGAPFTTTTHSDGDAKGIGQFGGGFEVRITRHIGWTNDFSWNVVDGPRNNFGMVRSGINVAF